MGDESASPGAPRLGPYEDTPRLASTVIFPTVFGAGMPTTSIADPLVGKLLDGRYEITSRLARGGMATVYQAVDTRLTRTVAVKIMHIGLGDDAEFARKFDRAAKYVATHHPETLTWSGSQGLGDDAVEGVRKLKAGDGPLPGSDWPPSAW